MTHYQAEMNGDDNDDAMTKKTSLSVFELIQHTLQCGPLAGSNPGYFKRCGGEVAKVVYNYLETIIPDASKQEQMGFSDKQYSVMIKWKDNARKAAENDKPPSKSVLKKQQKQQQANQKKKKNKK